MDGKYKMADPDHDMTTEKVLMEEARKSYLLINWLIGQEKMSTGSLRQKLVRKQSKVLSSIRVSDTHNYNLHSICFKGKTKVTYSEEIHQKS